MNVEERHKLDKLIKEHNIPDHTPHIRKVKHSKQIKSEVEIFINLKTKYSYMKRTNHRKFVKIVYKHCPFLLKHYMMILNKLIKDELNMDILSNFISRLSDIEEGRLDYHEASVLIGQLLETLYDSELKHKKGKKKQCKTRDGNKDVINKTVIPTLSWSQYKAKLQL
jgi:hypothetical protein